MPGEDVGGLAEADPLGQRGDRRLGLQRVRAVLGALGLEVVLGQEEVVEAEPVGQDALAHLVDLDPGGGLLGRRAGCRR